MAGGKVWLRCFLAFSRELQGAAGSVSRSYGALDCLWNRLVTAGSPSPSPSPGPGAGGGVGADAGSGQKVGVCAGASCRPSASTFTSTSFTSPS